MPPEEYSILFDKNGNGLTLKEIAERCGLSIDQVFYRVVVVLEHAKTIAEDRQVAQ